MANRRQKKKKSAAAAKQAAAQYKGKNAPVRPAAAPKKVEEAPEPQHTEPKTESKPRQSVTPSSKPVKEQSKPVKQAGGKSEPAKAQEKKKNEQPEKKNTKAAKTGKSKPVQKKHINRKVKFSKRIRMQIEAFGMRKFAAVVLAVSVVICAVCVIVWVTSSTFGIPKDAVVKYSGRNISSDLTLTVLEDIDVQYEYADKMKSKGDKKEFRYYAEQQIVFAEKNAQAPINLVNVTDNNCVLVASIVDEAGNICYTSLGLIPGQRLTDISIQERPYGVYDMKLVVAGYDPETYELLGVQSSDLTVQVGIEEETSDVQKETTQG